MSGEDAFTDGNGHGTHVAGTIAALANGVGVVGVAPGAEVISLKVFDSDGGGASYGTIISATNISIVAYAGDGRWCRQEDIYNPLRFVKATLKWCKKAQELGTLPDEAAAWMTQMGAAR